MSAHNIQVWVPYLGGIVTVYTVPLLFSKRARVSPAFAAQVLAFVAGIVFVMVSVLYPIGAGLVGPLSFSDYLYSVSVYVLPALLVWTVSAAFISLRRKPNG